MTKPCTHCGGWGNDADFLCNFCDGTGKADDDSEYEPEICPGCEGNGCRACKGSGRVWRKVGSETTKDAE